jgi:P-type Cu+ transporter
MSDISKRFDVKGMHCASCAYSIETKLSELDGVNKVRVNYATEEVNIDFDHQKVNLEKMNKVVQGLGYSFSENVKPSKESSEKNDNQSDLQSSKEKSKNGELNKLRSQTILTLPISLFMFTGMIWMLLAKSGFGFPSFPISMATFDKLGLIFATFVLAFAGKPFLSAVLRFVQTGVANMDSLVGIGTSIAYLYSATLLIFPGLTETFQLPETGLYFDVTVIVIGFIIFGKYLEAKSKMATGEALKKLIGLQSKTALILVDGEEKEVPVDQVTPEQIVV